MATDFPTEYDAIILGTGMPECILAAALARIGRTVLHIDRNDYYSGDWATFNFKALREWIKEQKQPNEIGVENIDAQSLLKEGEQCIPLVIKSDTISHVQENIFIRTTAPAELSSNADENKPPDQEYVHEVSTNKPVPKNSEPNDLTEQKYADPEEFTAYEEEYKDLQPPKTGCEIQDTKCESETKEDFSDIEPSETTEDKKHEPLDTVQLKETKTEWSLDQIENLWRKFNIDLMPKILYCRGPMVELLISSDIAKYCEFRAITRVLTKLKDVLQLVPCSRSDVFSSKQVNVIEKRMLMKLLTFCLEFDKHPEDYQGYENGLFIEFLQSKKLTPSVLHYTLHAIAMATDKTPTIEGLKSTQKFLQSLGRYGNTAFLWPLYGSGEIPQCFCRMCAVFGGVYCLRMTGHSIIVDGENKVQGIVDTEGRRLSAKWVIMEASFATRQLRTEEPQRKLSRAILLTSSSIHPDKDEHITLLSLPPPEGGISPISVLELSPLSMACPKGFFIVQMTCECVNDVEVDLLPTIHSLFHWSPDEQSTDDKRPGVLWSLLFNVIDSSRDTTRQDLPENVFILGGPNGDLDCDLAIEEAKRIFDQLCPGEEFLPKAPNPEDIIFDGDEGTPKDSGFSSQEGVADDTDLTENESNAHEADQIQAKNSEHADDHTIKAADMSCHNETENVPENKNLSEEKCVLSDIPEQSKVDLEEE